MMPMRISYAEMKQEFDRVLRKVGFTPERAATCAEIFAQASLDGIASHGLNRFPGFIHFIRQGYVMVDAEAERTAAFGAWEQWDGHLGPGSLNALACTERALELARVHGVGCVALCNTNHWMRAGTYGWRAAQAGFAFLCWTNTMPNMPAWGARVLPWQQPIRPRRATTGGPSGPRHGHEPVFLWPADGCRAQRGTAARAGGL